MLRAEQLKAGYGSITVVHGIDLEVMPGEVVALLGANGAGKTTTLLTLAGDIPAEGDRADEVHADKIRAESASQSFRYLITEHGDPGREHPPSSGMREGD